MCSVHVSVCMLPERAYEQVRCGVERESQVHSAKRRIGSANACVYFWNTLRSFISVALTQSPFSLGKTVRARHLVAGEKDRERKRSNGCRAMHPMQLRSVNACWHLETSAFRQYLSAFTHFEAMIRNRCFKVDLFCLGMSLLCARKTPTQSTNLICYVLLCYVIHDKENALTFIY